MCGYSKTEEGIRKLLYKVFNFSENEEEDKCVSRSIYECALIDML